MNKNEIELKKQFLACFHELPKEALSACIWASKNMDEVNEMIDTKPYPTEVIDTMIQDCLDRKDYVLLLLAVMKKQHDEALLKHSDLGKNPAPSK